MAIKEHEAAVDTVETLPATRPDWMPGDADAKTLETRKPLKLSEAMRFGSMSTVQIFNKLGDSDEGTACGVGAVFAGLGYQFEGEASISTVMINHPELRVLRTPVNLVGKMPKACSGAGHGGPNFGYRGAPKDITEAIVHLNDDHQMPRDKIADWLEDLGL